MTPPPTEEPNMGTILYRLDVIDGRFDRMESRFERMEGGIRSLSFVGVELYKSEQAAQDRDIQSAIKLSMWALGLVCTLVIGAIVSLIVKVAAA